MERIYLTNSCKCLQSGAVLRGGSFCIRKPMEMTTAGICTEQKDRKIQPLTDRRTTGRSWQTLLFGRQGRAFQVSGKIILTAFRYFSRKPCLTGSICRKALVVQQNNKVMNQAIISRPPMAPLQIHMPVPATRKKRTVEPEPAIKLPPRGTTGPVHISTLLNPILDICRHPDRNRLLAEFFKDA